MEWITFFAASWILFFALGLWRWKECKADYLGGIFSVCMQLYVDTLNIHEGNYVVDPVISLFGSSFFFTFGSVFTMGVLYVHYFPAKRWARILYLLFFFSSFNLQEYLLLKREVLKYIDWSFLHSMAVNFAAVAVLGWFALVVLKKEGNLK